MKLYIDTEFNGFQGELISAALVSEDGKEWYENLSCQNPVPWVKEHVIPILGKEPVSIGEAQNSLERFLSQWSEVRVVADWPEDIAHFCQLLITGPGFMMNTPQLSFEIWRIDAPSTMPHNALHDARGIKEAASGGAKRL